jgi:hypothetical protein
MRSPTRHSRLAAALIVLHGIVVWLDSSWPT